MGTTVRDVVEAGAQQFVADLSEWLRIPSVSADPANAQDVRRSAAWFADALRATGFPTVDAIEAWLPLFLFSVLFGLSMDYHVFLLSRIRERYSQTGDSSEAVAFGVRTTARLITGAALIIIAVFAGFARGDLVMFQQMGFGIAVALFIDATIIRSVVVPATMKLLGRWNWYLPSWLSWLPDVHVEGHEEEPEPRRAT